MSEHGSWLCWFATRADSCQLGRSTAAPTPRCVLHAAYGVGTVHAKAIAPPHLRSTTQSMFFSVSAGGSWEQLGAVLQIKLLPCTAYRLPPHPPPTPPAQLYYGVGPGISGLAGGYIYQGLGMRWVFILGSATLAVGWAAIQLALRWATRAERAAAAAARKLAP